MKEYLVFYEINENRIELFLFGIIAKISKTEKLNNSIEYYRANVSVYHYSIKSGCQ